MCMLPRAATLFAPAGRLAARIDCVPILCGPTTVFRVDAFKSRPFLNYRSFTTDWFASINHGANAQFVPGAPVGPVAVSIEAAAVAVWNSLQSCADLTVESLSDPQSRVLMPWPTVLRPQSDRMSMVANKYIYVDGREFFRDLYRHVMTNRKELRVNLMGTKGIGKSYRLAALAGLLLKKGIRVVYLPNCGGSSNTLVADLRSALLVAFGDMGSLSIRQQIAKLQTAEQLGTFCNSQPPESLTFVFDQFNGVQEDSAAEILYIVGEKNFARKFLTQLLGQISASHVSVFGYSANNFTARKLAKKQRFEFDFYVYGGYTVAEYDVWCEKNAHVFKSVASDSSELDQCKSVLRMASGGNPLLLDSFRSRFEKKANASFTERFESWFAFHEGKVTADMKTFIDLHKRIISKANMIEAFVACVSVGRMTFSSACYDLRHLFQIPDQDQNLGASFVASPFLPDDQVEIDSHESVGVCASGIANTAAANILRTTLKSEPQLLDVDLVQNSLASARSASNPVVLGYQVKRIALSSISLFGLDGVTPKEVVFFDAGSNLVSALKSHSLHKAGKAVLYMPKIFNYPKIDAVLVSHHPAEAIKAFKAVPTAANAIAHSSSTSTKPREPVSIADGSVHIQFIQISVGTIDSKKLQNTRSVLDAGSSERELWRHAAGVSAVNLKFSLRWLVSSDEAMKIQCSVDFNASAEKASPLSSVHAALNL